MIVSCEQLLPNALRSRIQTALLNAEGLQKLERKCTEALACSRGANMVMIGAPIFSGEVANGGEQVCRKDFKREANCEK